jgi:hypothetical protein
VAAIKKFNLDDERRNRLVVQERSYKGSVAQSDIL